MTHELLQPLIGREGIGQGVLSLYLDMSVNSENKRTHQLFLQQKRAEHAELDSDRPGHHREPMGAALERAEQWLDTNYRESNKGVALFIQVGGDWLEGIQLPVPLQNRWIVSDRPIIGPLAEVLTRYRVYGVALVDREHCRIGLFRFGELRIDRELEPEAYPTPHDIQKGGWAARDYQKYKTEETRQFFRSFSDQLTELDTRYGQPDWILLGTIENVRNFRGFLSQSIESRVIHAAQAPVMATEQEIAARLQPFADEHALQDEASALDTLRDRVRTQHLASAGVRDTLVQLQEGKVDTLVIARDFHSAGVQCTRCSFYLQPGTSNCPYCGGSLRAGIDLGESMIRMAASQDVELEFVDPQPIAEWQGVGALLKF